MQSSSPTAGKRGSKHNLSGFADSPEQFNSQPSAVQGSFNIGKFGKALNATLKWRHKASQKGLGSQKKSNAKRIGDSDGNDGKTKSKDGSFGVKQTKSSSQSLNSGKNSRGGGGGTGNIKSNVIKSAKGPVSSQANSNTAAASFTGPDAAPLTLPLGASAGHINGAKNVKKKSDFLKF